MSQNCRCKYEKIMKVPKFSYLQPGEKIHGIDTSENVLNLVDISKE